MHNNAGLSGNGIIENKITYACGNWLPLTKKSTTFLTYFSSSYKKIQKAVISKSKIQKENPFRFFYEGFPTAYSMQNWNLWNKNFLFQKIQRNGIIKHCSS